MRNIVLGVDGSSASSAATLWCADVALAAGARVHLVHGLQPEPELGIDQIATEATVADLLEGPWLAPLTSAGVDVTPRLVPRHPVDALLSVANEVAADLVVVGRTGHIRKPGRGIGSVAHKILQASTGPMCVVPAATQTARIGERLVVLGLDDSPDALAALDFAVEFGEVTDEPISAVRVVDSSGGDSTGNLVRIDIEALHSRVDDALGVLTAENVDRVSFTAETVIGNETQELLERAADASVLVLGRGRRHMFGGHLLGSNALHCVKEATCPVVVVPAPAEA